ncbi:MAG: hypothetical protein LUG99_02075, partial [Lachnospiraceae bacterium]|nr:hypothetical protein [Lachnospiraceae bacterium]
NSTGQPTAASHTESSGLLCGRAVFVQISQKANFPKNEPKTKTEQTFSTETTETTESKWTRL